MADRADDDFRPWPGPPRDHAATHAPRFVNRVLRASTRAGGAFGSRHPPCRTHRGAAFGRGAAAARLAGRGLDHRARRVVVKTRLVNLRRAGARSTEKHLRYVERDGVTRDGQRGQAYGADVDQADAGAFAQRSRGDRHQFRLILSADDAQALGDLAAFTRAHMRQVERDLGTKLDWIAVDHWDTDNPHTHIVLRGKDDRGADLVIARDYIARGMRLRAAELATHWLGRRSEREIGRQRDREVCQDRWTGLDRILCDHAREGRIDLRHVPGEHGRRTGRVRLVGRLQHLESMGLAQKQRGASWQLRPDTEPTLRAMGERDDILRSMQRALHAALQNYAIWTPASDAVLEGRIVGKGLHDEMSDRGYLIVESADACAHYVPLPAHAELSRYPLSAGVRVRALATQRRFDPGRFLVDIRPGRGRGAAEIEPDRR